MSQEIKAPVLLNDVSASPSQPSSGTLLLYSTGGKLAVQDSAGNVTLLRDANYQEILDGSGSHLPAEPILKFSGMTVADDSINGMTVVTGIDGHYIMDASGTQYTQRSKLIFRGDGINAIVDEASNDATAVVVTGGGGGTGDVASYISNHTISFPQNSLIFSGKTLTLGVGVKALVPNGKYGDGTWQSITAETTAEVTMTESIGPVEIGVLFLMDDGTLRACNAELYVEDGLAPDERDGVIWYDTDDNISTEYDASGDEVGQFKGVPIATFSTDADGNVVSVSPFGVVNIGNSVLFRYHEM
jgi:hypothetical protein